LKGNQVVGEQKAEKGNENRDAEKEGKKKKKKRNTTGVVFLANKKEALVTTSHRLDWEFGNCYTTKRKKRSRTKKLGPRTWGQKLGGATQKDRHKKKSE